MHCRWLGRVCRNRRGIERPAPHPLSFRAVSSFLCGVDRTELRRDELAPSSPKYRPAIPVITTMLAQRSGEGGRQRSNSAGGVSHRARCRRSRGLAALAVTTSGFAIDGRSSRRLHCLNVQLNDPCLVRDGRHGRYFAPGDDALASAGGVSGRVASKGIIGLSVYGRAKRT